MKLFTWPLLEKWLHCVETETGSGDCWWSWLVQRCISQLLGWAWHELSWPRHQNVLNMLFLVRNVIFCVILCVINMPIYWKYTTIWSKIWLNSTVSYPRPINERPIYVLFTPNLLIPSVTSSVGRPRPVELSV